MPAVSLSLWVTTVGQISARANSLRNNARRATHSPGRLRENISLARTIPIKERAHLHFRQEIYNLFNLITWDNPASLICQTRYLES
jgi:hypothetical protein